MENFLIYIGKSALAAGAFYLVFLALFQNRKQFLFNRIYLPVSLALSFLIPLITFTSIRYIEAQTVDFAESFAYLPEATVSTLAEPEMEWTNVLFLIYITGIILFFAYLLLGHYKAFRIVRASKLKAFFGTSVNVTAKDVHPFSFFNKIVLSEKTTHNPSLEMIVQHEQIHVRERHTIDILLGEILFLFQWFNPFAWLIKDAMKNNLEYLTDHRVTQRHNAEAYQLAMVGLADKKGVAPFLTALNGSQLKNRIIMMKQKSENKYSLLKQLVVLPLLAVLIMGLSNKEVKTEIIAKNDNVAFVNVQPLNSDTGETQETTSENIRIKGQVTDQKGTPLPGTLVLVKGTSVGTVADANGRYEIETDKLASLVFKMLGFDTQEVEVNEQSTINVELIASKANANDEVVVVGYGKKNELIGGSGTDISAASNERIRISATGKDAPLFIVDGKESKDVSSIEPGNIESMSVLKDESAMGIYGEKGKKGVVLIETKGAKQKNAFQVKGKITDKAGNPLSGASVIIKGKTIGTITDTDGNYILELEGSEEILVIMLPGFEKKEVGIDGNKELNVTLKKASEGSKSGYEITGPLKGTFDPTGNKTKIIPGSSQGLTLSQYGNIDKQPLYMVDGKILSTMENLDTDDIESISVLKEASATAMFGDAGKNGVVFISTKSGKVPASIDDILNQKPHGVEPMYIVDGKKGNADLVKNIDMEDIAAFSVMKDASATALYGDKGKDGVILITTKSGMKNAGKANDQDGKSTIPPVQVKAQQSFDDKSPLVIVDGKKYDGEINDISPDDIFFISVWKDKSATELYGDAAKDGVIIINTKSYKIKSMLDMRKFIAEKIKYPVAAQERNQTGDVNVFVHVVENGSITFLNEKPENAISLDDVVVVGYGPKSPKVGETDVVGETDIFNKVLEKEAKRVVSMLPAIDIPELLGKDIIMTVKFMLQ
ncbi:MAG: carboxypeptidase-like regulatory domain-containing protein [Draconibacterium sp.]